MPDLFVDISSRIADLEDRLDEAEWLDADSANIAHIKRELRDLYQLRDEGSTLLPLF